MKDKWRGDVERAINQNFIDSISNYADQVALQIGKKQYRYQELIALAKDQAKEFETTAEIISIDIEDPLAFTIRFLAVQFSGNYPMIGSNRQGPDIKNFQISDVPFFIGLTSGTTGGAKAYYRNWQSWEKGFIQANHVFNFEQIDMLITSSPLNTSLGLHTLCLALYLGKTFMKIDDVSELMTLEAPASLFTVPTFLLRQIDELQASSQLTSIIFGGGQLSATGLEQLKARLSNTQLIEFYGSSETSFISWQLLNHGKSELSVGRLFPEVKIEVNQDHELTVTSPYLFSGYLSASKTICPNRWQVDDLVAYQSGQLYLLGRQADMIDHAGNKVSPYDIEKIAKHYCQKCVAFGVADAVYGQVVALLMVQPSHKAMLEEQFAKELPKYKWPQLYLKTEHIPLTKERKISRAQLATAYKRGEFDAF